MKEYTGLTDFGEVECRSHKYTLAIQSLLKSINGSFFEFAGLTPEEINTIMEVEKQKQEMMTQMGAVPLQAPMNASQQQALPAPKVAPKKPSANKEAINKLKTIRGKLK